MRKQEALRFWASHSALRNLANHLFVLGSSRHQ